MSDEPSYIYNHTFLIGRSPTTRHPRASAGRLRSLLRPPPLAPGSPSPPQKDQVWHFYEAQLLHYGLVPSKSKAVAKKRLSQALEAGTLQVPGAIFKLERELKEQWEKDVTMASDAAELQRNGGGSKVKKAKLAKDVERFETVEDVDDVNFVLNLTNPIKTATKRKRVNTQSDTETDAAVDEQTLCGKTARGNGKGKASLEKASTITNKAIAADESELGDAGRREKSKPASKRSRAVNATLSSKGAKSQTGNSKSTGKKGRSNMNSKPNAEIQFNGDDKKAGEDPVEDSQEWDSEIPFDKDGNFRPPASLARAMALGNRLPWVRADGYNPYSNRGYGGYVDDDDHFVTAADLGQQMDMWYDNQNYEKDGDEESGKDNVDVDYDAE